MRLRIGALLIVSMGLAVQADEPKKLDSKALDKELYDTLRDVHNRGAEIYNRGDAAGCLRLFEGALALANPALHYRPEEQKLIKERMEDAAKIESAGDRAFALHELIEAVKQKLLPADDPRKHASNKSVRDYAAVAIGPERIRAKPRETEPIDLKKALFGQFFWQNEGLEGVKLVFVLKDSDKQKLYETTTEEKGKYVVPNFETGKYIVLVNPIPNNSKHKLPERYQTAATSPLIIFIETGKSLPLLLKP